VRLDRMRLWKGIALWSALYLLVPWTPEYFYWTQALEAMVFSAVILLAFDGVESRHWLVLLPLSALANVLVLFLFAPAAVLMLPIKLLVAPFDRFEVISENLAGFVAAALAAIVYCALLQFVLKPPFFNRRTYALVAGGCFLSMFHVIFDEIGLDALRSESRIINVHKVAWFVFFGLGLSESAKRAEALAQLPVVDMSAEARP
jgi:hypothetical protein